MWTRFILLKDTLVCFPCIQASYILLLTKDNSGIPLIRFSLFIFDITFMLECPNLLCHRKALLQNADKHVSEMNQHHQDLLHIDFHVYNQ